MKYQEGDIVRFTEGKVDWEVEQVVDAIPGWSRELYVLKSGMSDRRRRAYENELKPWNPHD